MARVHGPTAKKAEPPFDPDPRGFHARREAFMEWMRVRNYSSCTLSNYHANLTHFFAWCGERALTRPEEITQPILERYQGFLFHQRKRDGEPLSFRSQRMRLAAVQGFFRYLTRMREIPANPASELELPRVGKHLPHHVLTIAEAEKLLSQPDLGAPMGVRDRAILETFYSTGIRRAELAGLSVYDIDDARGTLLVRQGKGKKDRIIPIGERALAWVAKYREEVRGTLAISPGQTALFLNDFGESIGISWLSVLVRRYIKQAEIDKQGACHLLRHTMATLMLEGGADIRFIQEMLGHAELGTTQIYTQVSIRKLKEIHSATHPGARLSRPRPAESDHLALAESQAEEEAIRADLLSSLDAEAAEEDQD
jgi:integrase/recombinase XerD